MDRRVQWLACLFLLSTGIAEGGVTDFEPEDVTAAVSPNGQVFIQKASRRQIGLDAATAISSKVGGSSCDGVWDMMACKGSQCYTCGDRISWLKQSEGKSDRSAKNQVSVEFPKDCGACVDVPCSEVSESKACDKHGCYTCSARINYLKTRKGKSDAQAKAAIGVEFPRVCLCQDGPPLPTPSPKPSPPHGGGSDYRLLSFNVWWKNKKFDDIAGVIKNEVDPDIVNLQEAVDDISGGVVKALNRIGGQWAQANPWSRKQHWCGLTVYRSDKWDLKWHKEQGIWQSNDQRGICGALLQRKADGKQLCVIGIHPVWRDGGTSHWAKDAIKQGAGLIKECAAEGAPSSFFCDCNTMEHDSVRRQLERSTGWKWKTAAADGYDHIYIEDSPQSVGSAHDAGAISPKSGQRGCQSGCSNPKWGYSDHPPVFVDITPA